MRWPFSRSRRPAPVTATRLDPAGTALILRLASDFHDRQEAELHRQRMDLPVQGDCDAEVMDELELHWLDGGLALRPQDRVPLYVSDDDHIRDLLALIKAIAHKDPVAADLIIRHCDPHEVGQRAIVLAGGLWAHFEEMLGEEFCGHCLAGELAGLAEGR